MKHKVCKILKWVGLSLLLLIIIGLCFPTWTPKIKTKNGISELRKVKINDTSLEVMIRGEDKANPVILFVHGGPCCSEIPYVRKYQDLLEQKFTIVHYDQRGSGKSYRFFGKNGNVDAKTQIEDLIALTKYIEDYLQQNQVILIGHSYGTYLATQAAAKEPKLYRAYVGIGQMSDTTNSELDSLNRCIAAAQEANNSKDVTYLTGLRDSVEKGEGLTPRDYVRKYGFAAKNLKEEKDILHGFLFGTEYNLTDVLRYYIGGLKYQESLIMEGLDHPVSDIVTQIDLPVYFVMGQYDGMTSPKAAKEYLDQLKGTGERELVLFEESAHYPHLEEKEKYNEWMIKTFIER